MKNGLIMDHLKTEPCDNTTEGTFRNELQEQFQAWKRQRNGCIKFESTQSEGDQTH